MTQVLEQSKQRSYFTPLLLFLLLLQFGSMASISLLWISSLKLQHLKTVYVQTQTGELVSGQAVPATHREPVLIKAFTKEMVRGLYQMSLEREQIAEGLGLEIIRVGEESLQIPLTMLQASYGLSNDLQMPLLEQLGQAIPDPVIQGEESYILVFNSISEPIEIRPGIFEMQVLGYLKVFREPNQIAKSLPLKKRVVIQTVEMPPPPRDGTALETAIFQIRQYGLQIIEIQEI